MKQDHLHPFVTSTSPHICGSPPIVSTTSPRICGTPILSHRHSRTFAVTHPSRHLDTTASLRTFAVLYFVSTTTPQLSRRHRCTFAAHPLRLTDIAVHLRSTHSVSHDIAAHLRHTISSLRPPPPVRLHVHPFVSPTSLRICSSSTLSPRHRRAFTAHPLRLYDHPHPLCLTDIAVHLRFTHCLTDTAHLWIILFGLYDFTPHHSTSTFYLSGISRTRGSVGLFVIALACPKVVRLYRTYLRNGTVV